VTTATAYSRAIQHEPWLEPVLPPPGRVAVDIGANEGLWSVDLAAQFGIVHAFEPNPVLGAYLMATMPPNVEVHCLGLGEKPGSEMLHIYKDHLQSTLLPNVHTSRTDYSHNIEVTVKPLDRFPISQLDFIKVDVEGFEDRVMRGATQTLERWKPRIIVEIHNYGCLTSVSKQLASLGYELRLIPHPHEDAGREHMWLSAVHPDHAEKLSA
jgi:FkbM family methyltransferase